MHLLLFKPFYTHFHDNSDEDDYIKDPDQLIDKLPQPFRLVDKILTRVFDIAWEICSIRESIREEEASKIRPPLYDCAVHLDVSMRRLAENVPATVPVMYAPAILCYAML